MLAAVVLVVMAAPIRAQDADWLPRQPQPESCYRRESPLAPPDASLVLTCRVTAQGRLTGCRASPADADPNNVRCALKVSREMQMRLKTKSGQPVAGRPISFPVRFVNQ